MIAVYKVGDRVVVDGRYRGHVRKIRDDGRGGLLYTVDLDNPNDSSTGLWLARYWELSLIC